jgi:hypothetical protein
MKARWLRHLSSYEVRLVEKELLGQYKDPKTGRMCWHWGDCDLEEKVIRIRRDLTFIDKVWTLVHELTHAENPEMEEDDVYELGYHLFDGLSRRSMRVLTKYLDEAGE